MKELKINYISLFIYIPIAIGIIILGLYILLHGLTYSSDISIDLTNYLLILLGLFLIWYGGFELTLLIQFLTNDLQYRIHLNLDKKTINVNSENFIEEINFSEIKSIIFFDRVEFSRTLTRDFTYVKIFYRGKHIIITLIMCKSEKLIELLQVSSGKVLKKQRKLFNLMNKNGA